MISRSRALLLCGLLAAAALPTIARAEPDVRTRDEIAHLLAYLAESDCEFFRNGSWYDAESAVRHIQRKHDHLARRDRITTTESFIEGAASRSSTSGRPYRVRCTGAAEIDSAEWFRAELSRHRSATRRDEPSAQ